LRLPPESVVAGSDDPPVIRVAFAYAGVKYAGQFVARLFVLRVVRLVSS
jgi:hypothetical protein